MNLITSRRRCGVVGVAAVCLGLMSSGALAYTAEQQQACTGDAMRLCGEFVPDVDRITMCMVQNKALLTPVCRAHFGPEPVALRSRSAVRSKPVSLKPRKTAAKSRR